MKRSVLFYVFALASGVLAFILGLAELMNKVSTVCTEASCMKVQTSSFNRVFGVPIPFVALTLILLSLIFVKKRRNLALYTFSFLAGAEGYMFFIQAVFIRAYCKLCITFFVLVLLALGSLTERKTAKNTLGIGVFSFLISHFILFYPSLPYLPWKLTPFEVKRVMIIYSSPSCSHCREAEKELKNLSGILDVPIFERPVPLREGDRKAIRKKFLKKPLPLLERVVDAYIWENERDLKSLIGKVALPTLVLRDGEREKVLVGWNEETKKELETFYERKPLPERMEGLPWERNQGICTEEGPCR